MSGAVIAGERRAQIDDLVRKWNVAVDEIRETESSFLAFGVCRRQPVVLKVIKRDGDEWHSGEVLDAFGGSGVVRVFEHIPGALLLERATPGRSLVRMAIDVSDQDATAILARVMQQMSARTAPKRCATVQQWAQSFERYAASGDGQIASDLVEDGRRVYAQLAGSQGPLRLLHGDLHHDNVLSDSRRGWLAIDPKGVVGEAEYEVGASIRNPTEAPDLFTSPRTIERRLEYFARTLNLDLDRILRWAFAQAVLSAIWSVEDGDAVAPTDARTRLAKSIRGMLAASL
jgi:streptomycin 6-kinase